MRTRLLFPSTLGLAMILAMPAVTHAYSLGEIRIASQLGEAFYAEIPLHLREGEGVKEFAVSLGNLEEYLVLELHRSPVNVQLDVKVKSDARGPRIILKSESPIQEPFFNLLLKTTLGSGSHFRNFPIFLDMKMPKMSDGGQKKMERPPAVVQDVVRSGKGTKGRAKEAAVDDTPVYQGSDYGPVRHGENLMHIVRQLRGRYPGLTDGQIAANIWRRNPNAFHRGNMNALRAGVILNLPESSEVVKLSSQETREILAQQYRDWRGDGLTRVEPSQKSPAKAKQEAKAAPKTAPAAPAPEEKPVSKVAATPAESRRQNGQKSQTTSQPVAPPPAADKNVVFEQRVTMQTGDASSETKPGDAPPPVPTVEAPASEAVNLQLSKSLQRLETLENKLNDANSSLQSSEKARSQLQSTLATLQQRMDQLEKEKAELSDWSLQDILIYVGGGLGLLVLAGVAAIFARRRKPVAAPIAAATTELGGVYHRSSPFGAAVAGGAMAGAAVGMAAASNLDMDPEFDSPPVPVSPPVAEDQNQPARRVYNPLDLAESEDDEALAPYSPSEWQSDEEEEDDAAPWNAANASTDDDAENEASSWQSAATTAKTAEDALDLGGEQGDLDLDAFSSDTVMDMGEVGDLSLGDEHDSLMGIDSLSDSSDDLGLEGLNALNLASSPKGAADDNGAGMEELDFSSLDDFANGSEGQGMGLPAMGDDQDQDEEEGGNLFLPGASFDGDDEGTLEATPLRRGPGAPVEEMESLEPLDLASMGLGDEEESLLPMMDGDADLDLDGAEFDGVLSLGNLDDDLDSRESDGVKPIDVPSFDMVDMDFSDDSKPAEKKKDPPPPDNDYELSFIDLPLDDDVKK